MDGGTGLTPARGGGNRQDIGMQKGNVYVDLQERVRSSRIYAERIRTSERHCRLRLLLPGGGRVVSILVGELMS